MLNIGTIRFNYLEVKQSDLAAKFATEGSKTKNCLN